MGWELPCLLLLFISHVESQRLSCSASEDRTTPRCTITITCNGTIRYEDYIFQSLSCLHNYYGYSYDGTYDLVLNFMNMREDAIAYHPVIPHYLSKVKVKQLKYNYFKLGSIPAEAFDFDELTYIEITFGALETIDLSMFGTKHNLVSINASSNRITVLEEESSPSSSSQSLRQIDLSHNMILIIPNNYFFRFPNLLHLNLSYNYIQHFDILTFEGLSHLQSLYLSHNMLVSLDHSFVRFGNLQELMLDFNRLISIKEPNFNVMTQLRKLNLSSNDIVDIEDTTFSTLSELNMLDLSSNAIRLLPTNIFQNNNKLEVLILSSNFIQAIPNGIFNAMNISYFEINNNSLSGTVNKDTFQGISERESFDLSGNKIEILGDDVFHSFGSELKYLNLSHNLIANITNSAFTSADNTITLDMSFNRLDKINGYFDNLKEIQYLNISNNYITQLTKTSFKNCITLVELDLSFNFIKEIEDSSFKELRNLETLILCNNHLGDSFTQHTLDGLVAVKKIFLMNTETTSYEKFAFSGMSNLKIVNSSFGSLMTIDCDSFNNTGSIEILDLSHNLLEKFVLKNGSIPKLQELYLHNNKIQNITVEMFLGLTELVKLTLDRNHILYVQNNSFSSLFKVEYLDLSYNDIMELYASQIQNMSSLYSLSLRNVKTSYNFSTVETASLKVLDMSFCEIKDVKARHIYTLKNITDLNLSSNKITRIDKNSFQTMPILSRLNLSNNHIKYIQPGSFIHTNLLTNIDLSKNELPSLQYGVFDGLQNLDILNLSSNSLSSFEYNLLHNSPEVSVIILDDNFINKINLDSFDEKSIKILSLGGNLINCDVFINIKYRYNPYIYSFKVTTQNFDYHSENVDGMTCTTMPNTSEIYNNNVTRSKETSNVNMTALFDSLSNSIKMFQSTAETVANGSVVSKETSKELNDLLVTISKLTKLYNDSQQLTNSLLEKMTDNNGRQIQQVKEDASYVNTPVYVTLGCLILFSALCIFLSYSYFKRKSGILDANSFASNRHLANEIEME